MNAVDAGILILMITSYQVGFNIEKISLVWAVVIVVLMSALIGFLTTSYGLVAMLWLSLAAIAGYFLGRRHRNRPDTSA
ncbi:MAG: hypothetical protein IPM23_00755 [Candidatus Melainabacteria bacterium]|nr:hypothetical protein [Candidatus Melainabacteria bacterium]